MNKIQPVGLLVGRVLLAYIFVVAGFGKIDGFSATAAYIASKGLPMSEALLVATIVIELVGGLMIALGWKARWAALAIFVFLIPTTLIFHAFWTVDPEQVRAQTIQFNKNLAIMGGMLYIAIVGSGRYGLDRGS